MRVRSSSAACRASIACSNGTSTPISPVEGLMVPTKATAAMKVRYSKLGSAIPVNTMRPAPSSSMLRRSCRGAIRPTSSVRTAVPSERHCGDEPDLHRAQADRGQIGRKDDDGEAVAEPAQTTRRVKQADVRALAPAGIHSPASFPAALRLPAAQEQDEAHDVFAPLRPVGVDGDRGDLPVIVQHDISRGCPAFDPRPSRREGRL